MYVNFDNYVNTGLNPEYFVFLLAVKNRSEPIISLYFDKYKDHSHFKFVKGTKNDTQQSKIRLSKEGEEVVRSLMASGGVTKEDEVLFEWLKKLYLKQGKEVGSERKTKEYIRDFRVLSGIDRNKLFTLCKVFLSDTDNMLFNNKLEFAFYKPPTAYERNFKLEESRLYQYYLKRKEQFDEVFKKYD